MEATENCSESHDLHYMMEMGHGEGINLNNFAQYTLMPEEADLDAALNCRAEELKDPEIWHRESLSEHLSEAGESENSTQGSSELTPGELSMLKEIDRLLKRERATPPCLGQGDGPGSPVVNVMCSETNDPHQMDQNCLETIPEGASEEQEKDDHLTYATLESAKVSCVNFDTPKFGCGYQPIGTLLPPVTSNNQCPLTAFVPRSQVATPAVGRGYRPRQLCRTPVMTPYVVRTSLPIATSAENAPVSDLSFSSASSSFDDSKSSLMESDTSLEYPQAPKNTPNSSDCQGSPPLSRMSLTASDSVLSQHQQQQLQTRLEALAQYPAMDMRAIHNAKERKRRSRIRDACQAMRRLLPGVNERTDNASVFEQFASYINFLRIHVGDKYDIEYLHESQLLKDKYHSMTFEK